MYKENDFSKIRWAFDSRNANNVDTIKRLISEGVKKEKNRFAKQFGINIKTKDGKHKWNGFIGKFNDILDDFIEIVPEHVIN
jgi:hypothetical protein